MSYMWRKRRPSIEQKMKQQGIHLRVGFVGFSSSQGYNEEEARGIVQTVFYDLNKGLKEGQYSSIEIVSGYTAVGIPLLAYEEASKRGWKTVGIACSLASDFKCYPCDEVVIKGKNWGDESSVFLDRIDMLIKVGGGKQSQTEYKNFKGPKLEFSLSALS
eukprot:TRINITY_DN4757_c1_g1_i2.p1 TRINITY_DN4757_c1_g1~~TRINITY_DN4757_c1_g1_i2.p1  ORF type:complete len:160 (-),score=23.31 TRINITY_DN4757_c1_g1_i2:73-552(-)